MSDEMFEKGLKLERGVIMRQRTLEDSERTAKWTTRGLVCLALNNLAPLFCVLFVNPKLWGLLLTTLVAFIICACVAQYNEVYSDVRWKKRALEDAEMDVTNHYMKGLM